MPKEHVNDLKLGVFLITGLLVLVLALYMIGRDQRFFAGRFELRVRFRDASGLMPGNNVRYSGIQNGTVKSVRILDDTTIEVSMYIDNAARGYIRRNSPASIGSEGLMGNKVVNIGPGTTAAAVVRSGDILPSANRGDLSSAMGTLSRTGDNAAMMAEELLQTVRSINNSPVLQRLLADTAIPADIHQSLSNLRVATARINNAAAGLEETMSGIRNGQGAIGLLTNNAEVSNRMSTTIRNIHDAGESAARLMDRLDRVATDIQNDVNDNSGGLYVLLRDTSFSGRLSRSMQSVESGTAAFSRDMEALKHNILLRGYFRKLEKKKLPGN